MKGEKKSPVGGGTPNRAKETKGENPIVSRSQYTTKNTMITDILLQGRENALSRRELEQLTGFDGRTIRQMIEQERRAGVPILSDNRRGYFLAESPAEVEQFARSMEHRAGEILQTVKAVKEAAGLG